MTSPSLKTKLEYSDYVHIPSDGKRYELLEGDLHVTPAPSPLHQRVSKRLQRMLEAYFEETGRGEVFNALIDVILTNQDVVQPDLVLVTNAEQISKRGIEGPPLLLVEVLSPSTREYDRTAKANRYAMLGVFWSMMNFRMSDNGICELTLPRIPWYFSVQAKRPFKILFPTTRRVSRGPRNLI